MLTACWCLQDALETTLLTRLLKWATSEFKSWEIFAININQLYLGSEHDFIRLEHITCDLILLKPFKQISFYLTVEKLMELMESDKTTSIFLDMKKGYEIRSNLSYITNELKFNEKISVVFLLCKNSKEGFEIIQRMRRKESCNNLFYKWIRQQELFSKSNWREVLAEVLTIIQNYRLAKSLNFFKEELKTKFVPKNNLKTFYVSCVRKSLYNLSEELVNDQLMSLVSLVSGPEVELKTLEYYLLDWSERKIINLNEDDIDLTKLINSLSSLELNFLADGLELSVLKCKCAWIRSKFIFQKNLDFYPVINSDNVGLCIIISETDFTNKILPKRWGNEIDVQRLIEIFTVFGFEIKTHQNLTSKQLINTLSYYAETVDENISYFVLVILSHGNENVIYTSDSVPIEMDIIEMMFQGEFCPNLIGKPKIIIVQSCQGNKWQKVVIKSDEPEVTSDTLVCGKINSSGLVGPQRGDSMIAWSTVQGFASFRNKFCGSWYIEELCNELWKYGDALDLVEIFTRVNNNLRHKVYDNQFMVPSLVLSLQAKIKFPQKKENLFKGKKMMLERLIFEKYFKEFLIEKKISEFHKFIKIL